MWHKTCELPNTLVFMLSSFQAVVNLVANACASVWLPLKPMLSTQPFKFRRWYLAGNGARMGWRKVLASTGAWGQPAATPVVTWNQELSSESASMALGPV